MTAQAERERRQGGASMESVWNSSPSLNRAPLPTPVPNLQVSGNERWYAVYAQPFREALAKTQLAQQSFRAFVPLQMKTVRHARKLSSVKAPTFLRYLFVILDLERDRWRSVNGTSGVSRLVMAEGRPLPLPVGVVETLVNSADPSGLLHFGDDLKQGQAVRMRSGPFAEALGAISRLDSGARVEVLMKILNGQVRLNLPREDVEPL